MTFLGHILPHMRLCVWQKKSLKSIEPWILCGNHVDICKFSTLLFFSAHKTHTLPINRWHIEDNNINDGVRGAYTNLNMIWSLILRLVLMFYMLRMIPDLIIYTDWFGSVLISEQRKVYCTGTAVNSRKTYWYVHCDHLYCVPTVGLWA